MDNHLEAPCLTGGVEIDDAGQEFYGEFFDSLLKGLKDELVAAQDDHAADKPGIEVCDFLLGNILRQRAVVATLAVACQIAPELAQVFAQARMIGMLILGNGPDGSDEELDAELTERLDSMKES